MSNMLNLKQELKTKVKICGIKRIDEIEILNDYPVSYAGFIFAKSKRHISKEKARVLMKSLRPDIRRIGVFVNPSLTELIETINYCNLDGIQLHGDIKYDLEFAMKLKRLIISREVTLKTIWKSISVGKGLGDYSKNLEGDEDIINELPHIKEAKMVAPYVHGLLFDTYKKGEKGGTGEVFNWDMIKGINLGPDVILAGGLTPDNITEAITACNPRIVDVNSGLEEKYIKQRNKIDQLFKALYELELEPMAK